MPIFQGRTSRLKANFLHPDFIVNADDSVLTSVQVSYPQSSNTPLKQVGQRELAGSYSYLESIATVELTWVTEYDEGKRVFLRALQHFQNKSNGIVKNPVLTDNIFVCLTGMRFSTTGLNPSQFGYTMLFMNCPDMLSTEFDPLEFFGVSTEESESVINITDGECDGSLITDKSWTVNMRADAQFGLTGYRDIKFSEATVSESITSINSTYVPVWELDAYVYTDTGVIQHTRGLSDTAPRTYVTSRQANLIPLGSKEVAIGW